MKITNEKLTSLLSEIIPNPRCELIYNHDYELLISTVLSAQSTDKRVNEVTRTLYKKSLLEISKMSLLEIEKIIRPVGSYHKKAVFVKSIAEHLLKDWNGIVPNDRDYLESLPGVGRKTCNVVLSELFNVPAIAVDTHVFRVSKRLGLSKTSDDVLKVENKLKKFLKKEDWGRVHLQLVLFGRYYCTSKNPKCDNCLLKDYCKQQKK